MMKLNENPDAAKYEDINLSEKANKQELIPKKKRIKIMVSPCNHQYHVLLFLIDILFEIMDGSKIGMSDL